MISGGHDFSYIGRQGGCQVLSILSRNNPIIVAHEIKHALGWVHEQHHPNRDRYIEVDLDAGRAKVEGGSLDAMVAAAMGRIDRSMANEETPTPRYR